MWPFMKPKPMPPKPPYGSIEDIENYRRYALDQLRRYYEQICAELAHTDPETLTRLLEIITEFNAIEDRVDSALHLMDDKIKAVVEKTTNVKLKVYHDINNNLTFDVKEV